MYTNILYSRILLGINSFKIMYFYITQFFKNRIYNYLKIIFSIMNEHQYNSYNILYTDDFV